MGQSSKLAVVGQIGLGLLVLWLSLFLAWQSMRLADFGYPLLYDFLNVDAHVAQYGPLNRYKKDFALTERRERERLFHEIVVAIHSNGEGLEQLTYHRADGAAIDRLLRPPEVVHLQDVSRLLNILFWFSIVAAIVVVAAAMGMRRGSTPIMPTWRILLGMVAVVAALSLCVVLIGAKDVFYYLHTVIFPQDHQWFFYYQDSLMTTLMKAPVLFGPIAVALLALTVLWFALLWPGLRWLASRP